ncbi:MAG: class I SAM-dependent methyltransferase, partial [Pseudomonadota bacterium]
MNAAEQVKHFENLVNQEWNNATTVGAWRDWSDEQAIHCQPLTDGLIEHAQLGTGLNVLDIAGGVGQPAFPIAKIVGPTGAVVATDLSPGMLDVAAIEARRQDIQNVEFRVAD